MRVFLELDYAHSKITDLLQQVDLGVEETIQTAIGLEYLLTRSSTCYLRGQRSRDIASDSLSSYSRDQIIVGWSFQF